MDKPKGKRLSKRWKRAAEEWAIEGVREKAKAGNRASVAALKAYAALGNLAVALEWPELTIGEMAEIVSASFAQAWRNAPNKILQHSA